MTETSTSQADGSDRRATDGPYVGAIDQGTTGTRFLVYDRSSRVVASAYAGHDPIRHRPGCVEHDPEALWTNTVDVVERACVHAGIECDALAAVGVASQRQTTLLWDRATGRPLANALVWQDTRTADRVEELRSGPTEELIRDRTGLVPDTYFTATKLEWLLERTGAVDRPSEVCFGTVDSWLVYNLTGEHVTDVTNAAQTMLFDTEALTWDEELLAEFGVPRAVLPDVVPSSDPDAYGETTVDGLFEEPVPVTAAMGDQQAALLGNGCFDPGDVKVTYGAGSFALCNTGSERVDSTGDLLSTIVYQERGEDPVYALEGPVFTGGAAFDWLVDVGVIESTADVEHVLKRVEDTNGVYLVPGFRGLAAPHWTEGGRGLIVGVTPDTTRDHLVRAAIESVSYRVREVIDAMEHHGIDPGHSVRVDSGLGENDHFCRLQADVLDATVERSSTRASTALGAAYAAGRAVDYWTREEFVRCWESAGTFEPESPDARGRRYRQWRNAVALATEWNAPSEPQ